MQHPDGNGPCRVAHAARGAARCRHLGHQPAVGVAPALVRDEVAQRVEDGVERIGPEGLHHVGVAPDDDVGAVAAQQVGQVALRAVLAPFVLHAPVDADNRAVDRVAAHAFEVAHHEGRVDAVDDDPFGNGIPVGRIGVVEQGEADAAPLEEERVARHKVDAVGEDPRMADAAALQLAGRAADAPFTGVAAVVVGQHGHVDPRVAQRIGHRGRRAEAGIAREGGLGRERRLEVDNHGVGLGEAGLEVGEDGTEVVLSVGRAGGGELRRVGHHVAGKEQTHADGAGLGQCRRVGLRSVLSRRCASGQHRRAAECGCPVAEPRKAPHAGMHPDVGRSPGAVVPGRVRRFGMARPGLLPCSEARPCGRKNMQRVFHG